MSADALMILIMMGIFFLLAAIMLTAYWYTKKYKSKIGFTQIMLFVFALFIAGAYFFIKNLGNNEREKIVKNIMIKSVVTRISFDTHKPYFKNMTLADGQYLPMPENMNNVVLVGDSIYKNAGENYYTIVSSTNKTTTIFKVKTPTRILGKQQ